ncbi:hypothetical protein IMZ31_20030 (plasmid) [Pontibacillus sp. ALD_SL1]|uniref:hypothetical protein n=1 Tax=Pontibacillus sp. ALD_SL1 TaxID=2777185 RepID=UPI001A964BAB|nr:hypothetical protein [Pontibacillus sp. ALD_SL1]QST02841.1 hypothetical protein IMZ31_20030 [Pontibacillus sp. ALD_SL1]
MGAGYIFSIAPLEEATHWLAKGSFDETRGVTPYQFYRLNWDCYEKEYFIMNDEGTNAIPFLFHRGDFVTLDRISDPQKEKERALIRDSLNGGDELLSFLKRKHKK